MREIPKKCIVDTNIPITANLTLTLDIPLDHLLCRHACVSVIKQIKNSGRSVILIVDEGNEIITEYRHKLSMRGQPGLGDEFLKWVWDHQWDTEFVERVEITKMGESYKEFPSHTGLTNLDISDRKFIAVANAHPQKPPILQATDCKWWWWWKDALAEAGITVEYLCPEYIEAHKP